MRDYTIHAVFFRHGDWWISQCLEYDLVTQSRRLEDLPSEVRRQLTVQIAGSVQRGIEPFAGLPPAPRRFWEMFDRAQSRVEPIKAVEGLDDLPEIRMEARLAA
jgi:hypothetical protein